MVLWHLMGSSRMNLVGEVQCLEELIKIALSVRVPNFETCPLMQYHSKVRDQGNDILTIDFANIYHVDPPLNGLVYIKSDSKRRWHLEKSEFDDVLKTAMKSALDRQHIALDVRNTIINICDIEFDEIHLLPKKWKNHYQKDKRSVHFRYGKDGITQYLSDKFRWMIMSRLI